MTSIQAAGWIAAAFLAGCGVGPLLQAGVCALGRWVSSWLGPVSNGAAGRTNKPTRSGVLRRSGSTGDSADRSGAGSGSRMDPGAVPSGRIPGEAPPLTPEQQAQVERFRREWQSFLEYDGFPGGRL